MIQTARQRKDLTVRVMITFQFMRQEVNHYFKFSEWMIAKGEKPDEYSYWQVAMPDKLLAFLLLDLACKKTANSFTEQFEAQDKAEYLVEAYNHPVNKVPGLWMSIKGMRFSPEKLKALPPDSGIQ